MGERSTARRLLRAARGGVFAALALGCATSQMNQIDALMREYSCEGRLQPADAGDRLKPVLTPGASVLVVRDGNVLVRQSFGMANLEEHIAAAPDTNYRLASLTKQFTAASILLLGIPLDDSIRKYLPS